MSVLYSLRNLTQRFGEREVLNISGLEIQAGEIYALLGANGAGKSTLMRILAFLDSPAGGELLYKGQPVQPGLAARYRQGVVWVPQFPVMFTGSLLYNIEYPMALKHISRSERKAKARELLEQVKLGHLAKAPAHKLSGGESQRASIARALAAGAETILFDEPTANVDQRSLGDFIAMIREIWEQKRLSILISTHNPNLAAALCRRQIFLAEGRLVRQYMVPGGAAWPGRLVADDERLKLLVTSEALANPSMNAAKLIGLASLAAGISLRLETRPGHELEILLEDSESRRLAGALTLGESLAISGISSDY